MTSIFPLGGSRVSRIRTYLNLIVTFLLGGLWHGVHWKFVIWGGLHGVALAAYKFSLDVRRARGGTVTESRLGAPDRRLVSHVHVLRLRADLFRSPELAT